MKFEVLGQRQGQMAHRLHRFSQIGFLFLVVMFCLVGVIAAEDELSDEELAEKCLKESLLIIEDFEKTEINTNRVLDIYELLNNSYDAQMIMKERDRRADFTYVINSCNEIKKISGLAFISRDLISGLKEFYDESITNELNSSSIDVIMDEIDLEYENERYEAIEDLVDKAYDEIIEVKTSSTTLNLFYESTKNNVTEFFIKNYKIIILSILILTLLFLIFRKLMIRVILKFKMNNIEMRKSVLKDLIGKTQKEYFDNAKMSKGMYDVRLKKFSEMVRELDRESLVLGERLYRYSRGKNVREVKKHRRYKKHKK